VGERMSVARRAWMVVAVQLVRDVEIAWARGAMSVAVMGPEVGSEEGRCVLGFAHRTQFSV